MPLTWFLFTLVNIWCVTLFVVLPWGVNRVENPDPHHDAGAPEKPNLVKKILITTVIALLITCVIKGVMDSGIIQLRP